MKLIPITNGRILNKGQEMHLFRRLLEVSWLRSPLIWMVVMGLGLISLLGRYYHVPGLAHARIGFFCSAYFLVIFTPVLFYLVRELTGRPWVAIGTTGLWLVIATLPYYRLGLDRFYYPLETIVLGNGTYPNFDIVKRTPDWFPQAINNLPAIPGEGVIFFVLILLGAGLAVYFFRSHPHQKKWILLGLAGYLLILLESWLHLSVRSPYGYITKWNPGFKDHFFAIFLFPNLKGMVNADQPVFHDLELLFMGKNYTYDMLFRRSFYAYLTSQFSYFINTYYVSLILNIALWCAATACGYLFTRRYWTERVAWLTAGFIATGSGFIMYVAQPMSYLAGYASIIILVYLFDRLVTRENKKTQNVVLFAALLGLASLVYDIFPVYVFLIGFALYKKVNLKSIIFILLIAGFIYGGLIVLYEKGLHHAIQTNNSQVLSVIPGGFMAWALKATADQWYMKIRDFISQFSMNIISGFMVLPAILAVLGIAQLKSRDQKVIILLLTLPAFLTQAVLQFGSPKDDIFRLYEMPRFVYIAYPAVFILAALLLDHLANWHPPGRFQRAAAVLPWVGLLAVVILNNIDVLGIPALYYHLYYSVDSALFLK